MEEACDQPPNLRRPAVGDKPGRLRDDAEGLLQNAALDPIKHVGVVDETDAALNILQRVPGKGAPGRFDQAKDQARPGVDGDRAVFQTDEELFEAAAAHGLDGLGVDDDVGAERALKLVVTIADGVAEETLGGARFIL